MARHTIELRHINQKPFEKLFDFEYKFYNEDNKKEFEEKFLNYFFFREIGFTEVDKFKKQLQTKLNIIYPYYVQLYDTELKSKGITFLLNKDLKETFIREVESENLNKNLSDSESTSNTENQSLNKFSDTPQNKIDNIDNYLTSVTKDTGNGKVTTNSNSNNLSEDMGKSSEKTELISQGNIGTTSSASLLQEWRNVLINIDELILKELEELFMGVF